MLNMAVPAWESPRAPVERRPQLPGYLPTPPMSSAPALECPACGDAMADVFVDGLFKLKHCKSVAGDSTVLAHTVFVDDDRVARFAREAVVRSTARQAGPN